MIVGLVGKAGSGKSTIAKMLGGVEVAFAEPLKRFCGEVFGWPDDVLYGPSHLRNIPINGVVPRDAIQKLGTEWGRALDPDIWANAGIRRAQREEHRHKLVVISDCRLINEAKAVRAAGGQVWRVLGPAGSGLTGDAALHSSEQDMDTPGMWRQVTHIIRNEGSLEELRSKVLLLRP